MKKMMLAIMTGLLALNVAVAGAQELRTIPYPAGTDTKAEGASSAPKEIDHSDSIYFTQTDYFNLPSTATRYMITHYPTYQQTREYTCGPAAVLTVLYYYNQQDQTEATLSKGMHTQPYSIGTSLGDMVKYLKKQGWQVESSLDYKPFDTYEKFQGFVTACLKKGMPVLVENVEWGGHWRVIIGYDTMGTSSPLDDVLIMADPYDTGDHKQDGYAINNGEKFYAMWFDHSMLPKSQTNQPWLVVYPK